MSPQSLLARWRDRWDKPTAEVRRIPYVYGKVKRWSDYFTHSAAWSRPAQYGALSVLGLVLMSVLLTVRLPLQGQIVASANLVVIAFFMRRYGGLLFTLILLWLSLCATGRYLLWRFNDTLGSPASADFLFAFILCVAELYLSLKLALGLWRNLWTVTRPLARLPAKRTDWPKVDVFIRCAGAPPAAVAASARAALALDWPRHLRVVHLLDDDARPEIDALGAELGVTHLVHPDARDGGAGCINHALAHSWGDLVLMLDCDAAVRPDLLIELAGDFVHSPALAMLQSPGHFLAPPPSPAALAQFAAQQSSFGLLRRSALARAGGVAEQSTSWQLPTALKLQALGFACCYAGLPAPFAEHDPERAAPTWVKLERPFSPWIVHCQRALASLHNMLRFYDLGPRLVFWAAPLLALLGGVKLIDAQPDMFGAFLLPHLLHAYTAVTRMRQRSRMNLPGEILELLLACYMLLPTTFNVLRALLARARGFAAPARARPAPFAPAWQGLHVLLVLLHLAALAAGAWALTSATPAGQVVIALTMLWCAYHLLLLAAMLAVSEEGRQIGLHLRLQAARPAMLGLPLGRTLSCTTINFPAPELALRLPLPIPLKPGSPIRVALFEGHDEWTLNARVLTQEGCVLQVGVDQAMLEDYREFGARALARGPDWPAWLAGRSADRPFPAWVHARATALLIGILDIATHGRFLHWLRFEHLSKLWKKKNED